MDVSARIQPHFESDNSRRDTFLRLIVSSVGAAFLLTATVVIGLYLGTQTQDRLNAIEQSWKAYSAEADRRGELLVRIRGHLGYGGIIHNFKNYVLRKDAAYLDRLQGQLNDFGQTIEDYRQSGASRFELDQLQLVEQTIASYASKIPDAVRSADEGWPIAETDRMVKVDDTAAIAALVELDRFWRDKRQETLATISGAVEQGNALVGTGYQALAALAAVALVLYLLFFNLQRELRGSITSLRQELAERKAAQHAANVFYRAVDQSPATIIITDTDGNIEYVNEKFCSLTGYSDEDVLGKTPRFLQSGETPQAVYRYMRQQLERGETWTGTFKNRKKDGSNYWAKTAVLALKDELGRTTNLIGLGEDITERRKARDQVQRAQKLEAVGLMAGGVAHDLNNVMTTILGNVYVARMDMAEDAVVSDELEQIELAAKRARNLVGQVLAFGRRPAVRPIAVRVDEILSEMVRLLRATIHPGISIEHNASSNDLTVLADPTRLHQVLMNLGTNAADAIGVGEGRITISARLIGDTARPVCIEVKDDGPGIPEELHEEIFDPFYTSKPVGKGTGLGLSLVASLVGEIGGKVELDSAPGQGSTFRLLLPETRQQAFSEVRSDPAQGQDRRILLIDDEPEVLAAIEKVLRRQNYKTDGFTDPREALAAFADAPHAYDLVMTDYLMPHMNGEEVAQAIREHVSDVPIVVCSAHQTDPIDPSALGPVTMLEKPVDPHLLLDHLGRLAKAEPKL